MEAQRSTMGIRIIGGMKLASALLLAAAGIGVFRMIDRDLGASVEDLITRFHLDPDNRVLHTAIDSIAGLDDRHLKLIGLGTFFYAFLHLIEGTGLILRKRWAEYFTVIVTGSILPLEFYELARKVTAVRAVVLLVNLAIVAYLVAQLVRDHRDRKD